MGAGRIRGATALVAAALLLGACGERTGSSEAAAEPAGSWAEVPAAPLSPRLGAVTAWTGREALVLGGDVGDPCPPGAGCARLPESAADGAAYDSAAQTWRPLADAPYPIPGGTPSTVTGDTVFLLRSDRLLSYDASEDAWSVSPPAPVRDAVHGPAVLDDGTVVLVDAERDGDGPSGQVYDPRSRTWTELPGDPLGPTADRAVTAVPGGFVLTAAAPSGGEGGGPVLRAAVLDQAARTWTALDDDRRSSSGRWSWTGRRMIDVLPDALDGDGGRFRQGGALDPRTGAEIPLEGTPLAGTGGWPADATGGPLAAVDGWVYDDRTGTWTSLGRPDGAPAVPGPAVWMGDELLVVGGADAGTGPGPVLLGGGAWLWRPAGDDPPG